jgi:hypothetical protein
LISLFISLFELVFIIKGDDLNFMTFINYLLINFINNKKIINNFSKIDLLLVKKHEQ